MKYPCLDGQDRDFVPGTKVGVTDAEPPVGTLLLDGNGCLIRTSLGMGSHFWCYDCNCSHDYKFIKARNTLWEAGV